MHRSDYDDCGFAVFPFFCPNPSTSECTRDKSANAETRSICCVGPTECRRIRIFYAGGPLYACGRGFNCAGPVVVGLVVDLVVGVDAGFVVGLVARVVVRLSFRLKKGRREPKRIVGKKTSRETSREHHGNRGKKNATTRTKPTSRLSFRQGNAPTRWACPLRGRRLLWVW